MSRHRLPVVDKLQRYRGQPGIDFAIDALEECSITGKSPFKAGAAARGLQPYRGQPGIDYAMQTLNDCGSTAYASMPSYDYGVAPLMPFSGASDYRDPPKMTSAKVAAEDYVFARRGGHTKRALEDADVMSDVLRRYNPPNNALASDSSGISGWWLVPTLLVGGVLGVLVGSVLGIGVTGMAMCDMSPDELKKFMASCPPGMAGNPKPAATPAAAPQS